MVIFILILQQTLMSFNIFLHIQFYFKSTKILSLSRRKIINLCCTEWQIKYLRISLLEYNVGIGTGYNIIYNIFITDYKYTM